MSKKETSAASKLADIGAEPSKIDSPDDRIAEKPNPLEGIFRLIEDDPFAEIIAEALASQAKGPLRSARQSLNSAIDGCKEIRIRGFARASKAKPEVLAGKIEEECRRNPRLLGAVLRVWRELRMPLRDRVNGHLAENAVAANEIDLKDGVFTQVWEHEFWREQVDALQEQEPEAERDWDADLAGLRCETALMLALSASALPAYPGEMHAANIQSPDLLEFLNVLWRMPASDPIWQDMSGFTATLDELDAEKEREIIQLSLAKRSGDVRDFLTDFAPELAYLECESDSLRKIADDFPKLLLHDDPDEFDALVGLLQRYRAIRPQGESRSEEASRSVERASLEEKIIEALADWRDELDERRDHLRLLLERERERNDSPAPEESPDPEESGPDELHENLRAEKIRSAELKARYDEQGGKLRELKKTLKKETKAKEALAGEVAQLRERMEKLKLNSENGPLNGEGESRGECLVRYPPAHLENVKDAVSQAERTFSDELHLALNAKS